MKWRFKSSAQILLFLVVSAIVPRPSFGVDCSQINNDLSMINLMKSKLVAERKLDAALKETYGKLEYLSCIKDFNRGYVDAIAWLANDLGFIYRLQELDEKKALALYEDKIGKQIKNREIELYVFYGFVQFYAAAQGAEWGFSAGENGNICTSTTDWGTVYYGCDKIYRVANSPVSAALKTNDISLPKALINISYIEGLYGEKTCYKKKVPFEAFYGGFSMMIEENRIMKIVEKAPIMAKRLIDKSLKLDEGFSSLADFCRQ